MRIMQHIICLTALFMGTSAVFAQSDCLPCDPCGKPSFPLTFGGWVEMGVYTNSHSSSSNGVHHAGSKERTDFLMNQLYLFGEKELNTKHGFDWGGRADLVYGVDGPDMQCYGDETFDYNWGTNRHGYGMAAYQLYGTLGYKELSVKMGKFSTPVGWEASASKDNFFYSHSYCYMIEPATHTGVLADYNLTDRLTVSAGWTTGMDSSFENPNNNHAVLAGLTYALTGNTTVYYWINKGKQFEFTNQRYDYFIQSLCFEEVRGNHTTVFQYDLRNDNAPGGGQRISAYGINIHSIRKLNDMWSSGLRFEWLRNNGGDNYFDQYANGDYYGLTWGLNWNPCENLSIRPEVRYDWFRGTGTPFGDAHHKDQVTGGVGLVLGF